MDNECKYINYERITSFDFYHYRKYKEKLDDTLS